MARRLILAMLAAASSIMLTGCVTTSLQGYADLQPPPHPIQHIAAIAPPALIQPLASEAAKRGVVLEDANVILPRHASTMKLRSGRPWRQTGSMAFWS
jgi:hypothetical protein